VSAPRRRDVDATIDEIGGAEQDLDRMEPVPASGAKGDAAGAGDDGEWHAIRGVGGANTSRLHPAIRAVAEAVGRRLQARLRAEHRPDRPAAVGVHEVRGRVRVAE